MTPSTPTCWAVSETRYGIAISRDTPPIAKRSRECDDGRAGVPIPAPTRASPSQADNPNRSHTRRACIISRRSLTSSRNTRVCRKTTQVRCEPTTRDGCFFGPFATTTRRGAAISGADSEGWRSPRPRPGTRASSDRHRAPSDFAQRDRARSRSPTLR